MVKRLLQKQCIVIKYWTGTINNVNERNNRDNMNIDIEKIREVKEELDALNPNDILYIEEDGKAKYAVVPIELFDQLEDVLTMMNTPFDTSVRIAAPDEIDLTYDEYERIKKQIMEAVEKTFMPKPEKLN